MSSRQALGKGLEALLGTIDSESGTMKRVALGDISPNPYQPRVVFDEAELQALCGSVKRQGVLQPVTLRPKAGGGYELISGERRWRAAQMAGLPTIPSIIRESNNGEALELALVENLQRQDLNPMESAQAYQRMITEFQLTQEQVSQRVGKDRSSVANTVRLLNLPLELQEHIQAERLSMGHAKVLLSLDRPDLQINIARRAISERLSVRQLEAVVQHQRSGSAPAAKSQAATELEARLAQATGVRVAAKEGKRSGRIELCYRSQEERDRLVAALCAGC